MYYAETQKSEAAPHLRYGLWEACPKAITNEIVVLPNDEITRRGTQDATQGCYVRSVSSWPSEMGHLLCKIFDRREYETGCMKFAIFRVDSQNLQVRFRARKKEYEVGCHVDPNCTPFTWQGY